MLGNKETGSARRPLHHLDLATPRLFGAKNGTKVKDLWFIGGTQMLFG